MVILSILFFITAILYSSVGFGGGSTYLALMLIWDLPYYIIPILALFCNIIVVSGNSINYLRSGNINLKLLFPYLAGSIPFAFFGASISIEKNLFEIILFFILTTAGVFLFIESKSFNNDKLEIKKVSNYLSILIGSVIGFFSGIVGIGGGIFSVPLLKMSGMEMKKAVGTGAACAFPIALLSTASYLFLGWSNSDLPEYAIGYVYLPGLIGITIFSYFFAKIGAQLAHKLNDKFLQFIFAAHLVPVAIYWFLR